MPQRYLPDEVAERRYYEPTDHGFEQEIARAWKPGRQPMTTTELAAVVVRRLERGRRRRAVPVPRPAATARSARCGESVAAAALRVRAARGPRGAVAGERLRPSRPKLAKDPAKLAAEGRPAPTRSSTSPSRSSRCWPWPPAPAGPPAASAGPARAVEAVVFKSPLLVGHRRRLRLRLVATALHPVGARHAPSGTPRSGSPPRSGNVVRGLGRGPPRTPWPRAARPCGSAERDLQHEIGPARSTHR